MQGAAVHDRLASGTYQRLNAGLLLLLGIAVAASWSVLSVQALPVRLAWYWTLLHLHRPQHVCCAVNLGAHLGPKGCNSVCRVTVVSLVSTLCLQVQGGQGNVLQSLESAVRSISDAATSAFAMSGINSAAYALGAIGAAFAALTDWTQLTDGVALTAAGQASQAWPGQMIAATSVFATIVLLVLKVRCQTHRTMSGVALRGHSLILAKALPTSMCRTPASGVGWVHLRSRASTLLWLRRLLPSF